MADKKLFTLTEAAIDGTMKIAFGKSGADSKNATLDTLKTWVIPIPSTVLLTKVVDIGCWDMQRNTGTACHHLGLGVTRSKVRSIDVTILSNSPDYKLYPISHATNNGNCTGSGWHMVCSSATAVIDLYSNQDSYFNNTVFNGCDPGTNRGYVTVWYTP
jgi:hypothetical protein